MLLGFSENVPFLDGSGGFKVDSRVRERLLSPVLSPVGEAPLSAFTASCLLVQVAGAHHPSLLDVLLFPTALEGPAEPSAWVRHRLH